MPTHPRVHRNIISHDRKMRRLPTSPEARVWRHLQNKSFHGHKFRRQHPIGPYIVDFYCHRLKLAIEVDGGIHHQQIEYDRERTEWLRDQGVHVIRFWNSEVLHDIAGVMTQIEQVCQDLAKEK